MASSAALRSCTHFASPATTSFPPRAPTSCVDSVVFPRRPPRTGRRWSSSETRPNGGSSNAASPKSREGLILLAAFPAAPFHGDDAESLSPGGGRGGGGGAGARVGLRAASAPRAHRLPQRHRADRERGRGRGD